MKKKTLLQKAKEAKHEVQGGRTRRVLDRSQRIDLALAWMKGVIGTASACEALLGHPHTNGTIYAHLAGGLKDAFVTGRLRIK